MTIFDFFTLESPITKLTKLAIFNPVFLLFPLVFPNVGEEAIMVGVFHRQIMGAMVLVFSIFHWFMRDAEEVIAKRFLFASGISFLLNALILLKVGVIDPVTTFPFPPFILLLILSSASFYFSKKEYPDLTQ